MSWLDDAVSYEIYPQSFADSNGDAIGDLQGALDQLDHLAWRGVNTIWFDPCFASPFRDAGYDVSDHHVSGYLSIAPRYGSDDDLVQLGAAARDGGIRVVLDLVAGHTSVAHAWLRSESGRQVQGAVEGDRYAWSQGRADGSAPGEGWVSSPGRAPAGTSGTSSTSSPR